MKRFLWTTLAVLAVTAVTVTVLRPDWVVDPSIPKVYALTSDKCYSGCTNPDRPYFDSWGNEYDASGNLIEAAKCTVDPITGQPNPVSCTIQPNLKIVPTPGFAGK